MLVIDQVRETAVFALLFRHLSLSMHNDSTSMYKIEAERGNVYIWEAQLLVPTFRSSSVHLGSMNAFLFIRTKSCFTYHLVILLHLDIIRLCVRRIWKGKAQQFFRASQNISGHSHQILATVSMCLKRGSTITHYTNVVHSQFPAPDWRNLPCEFRSVEWTCHVYPWWRGKMPIIRFFFFPLSAVDAKRLAMLADTPDFIKDLRKWLFLFIQSRSWYTIKEVQLFRKETIKEVKSTKKK